MCPAPRGETPGRGSGGEAGPETEAVIGRQVRSPSTTGSVAVTQSTIFRWPVVVLWSAGWAPCPRTEPVDRIDSGVAGGFR
ncbi:hypothetical protein NGM37_48290 [Streptomyces sp. TRM76130]|nr:hypothetical protein [Streptomyces sp. TRM76130]